MAVHKPIIFDSARLKRLPDGDVVEGAATIAELQNREASAIVIGNPVYHDTIGVKKGLADDLTTAQVIGLVIDESIAASAIGKIQCDGKVVATTTQWNAIVGGGAGLSPGKMYYLDPLTAGMMTISAPIDVGDVVTPIGKAISSTELLLTLKHTVGL